VDGGFFFRGDDQMRRLDEARRSRGHRRGVRVGGGERYGRRSSSHFPPLTRSRGVRARWDPCLILRHRGAGGLDLDRQPVDRWETSFRFSGFLGVSALILVAVKYSGNSARIYWQLARTRTEVKILCRSVRSSICTFRITCWNHMSMDMPLR
jgi:hypothetical protein